MEKYIRVMLLFNIALIYPCFSAQQTLEEGVDYSVARRLDIGRHRAHEDAILSQSSQASRLDRLVLGSVENSVGIDDLSNRLTF